MGDEYPMCPNVSSDLPIFCFEALIVASRASYSACFIINIMSTKYHNTIVEIHVDMCEKTKSRRKVKSWEITWLQLVIAGYSWLQLVGRLQLVIVGYSWLQLVEKSPEIFMSLVVGYSWLQLVIVGYSWLNGNIPGIFWIYQAQFETLWTIICS